MADQGEHYEKSWILHHILDRMIGSREMVDIRRKLIIMNEYISNVKDEHFGFKIFQTGSVADGFEVKSLDRDFMYIDDKVEIVCANEDTNPQSDCREKTIFCMRNADSRPSYVTLELVQIGRSCHPFIMQSIVPVMDDQVFISSMLFAHRITDRYCSLFNFGMETHGPATTIVQQHSHMDTDFDLVFSFPCASWPPVANEWLTRPRLHGWPDKALIYDISQSGCHVVPVGDKTSADTFLQWRISFSTAERKLIHSLSHTQFLVYGLLKYFLKQVSGIFGDTYILTSYIMKTVVFFAVENTPPSLWKEQNTFLCFMYCLKMLISWIHVGYCPNYFIRGNNMFLGKILGEKNQQNLVRFFTELHDMNWMCLSVGTSVLPFIYQSVMNGALEGSLFLPQETEYDHDMHIFRGTCTASEQCSRSLALLSNIKSDMDEFIAYRLTVTSLSFIGMKTYGEHIAVRGNKEKYKSLRKCKSFVKPSAAVGASQAQLVLATYYYKTGSYSKSLELCGNMISSFKVYADNVSSGKGKDRYKHLYCGRGYTLLKKYHEVIVSNLRIPRNASDFCPSTLHEEIRNAVGVIEIPPLPYALFISFMCYHELEDTRRRDTTLINLRVVKYDEEQGGSQYWIVHNLIGICYEIIGDIQRATREYRDSLSGFTRCQKLNPASKRIARLQDNSRNGQHLAESLKKPSQKMSPRGNTNGITEEPPQEEPAHNFVHTDISSNVPQANGAMAGPLDMQDETSVTNSFLSHKDSWACITDKNVDMNRRVRMIMVEGKLQSWKRAEVVVKILDIDVANKTVEASFGEIVEAVKNCQDYKSSLVYLSQKCQICLDKFPMSKICSLSTCECKICDDCMKGYFEVSIRERHVCYMRCPLCEQPDMEDSRMNTDYLTCLTTVLKRIVSPEDLELNDNKLRDWTLQKDPHFRWCTHCGNGFIWDRPDVIDMVCPQCKRKTCYSCKKQWEDQHEGLSCEEFDQWKIDNDPENQAIGLAKHLQINGIGLNVPITLKNTCWEDQHEGLSCEEFDQWKIDNDPENQAIGLAKHLQINGIDCPSCKMRYALAKGGCMHFKCPQCGHEFCSGCSQPFVKQGPCVGYQRCQGKGIHSHHPRDCFYYLRDNSVEDLQRLLRDNKLQYNHKAPDSQDMGPTCPVMEQKEMDSQKKDEQCGRDVLKAHAGLCVAHYKEYLVGILNKHKADPVNILSIDQMKNFLQREEKNIPPQREEERDAEYRKRLVSYIKETIPIERHQ